MKTNALKIALPCAFLVVVSFANLDAKGQQPPPVGGPLPGLTANEMQRFNDGLQAFLRVRNAQTGLGPVFNGVSCVQCHRAAAPGGASADLGISVVTRVGSDINGQYSDIPEFGGAVIQRRSLREFNPNYPVPGEVVPAQATIVSLRLTTPLFGDGLIEAIPAVTILALADPDDADHDGISGRANMVLNVINGQTEVGRFGWKSQISTLQHFSAEAFINEMSITSPTFPLEVRPQGGDIPPGADIAPDPEDAGDVVRAADFMRFMAPPPPMQGSTEGRILFTKMRCASCHTPTMTTGTVPSQALSQKPVNLYSDLLLHDMGPGLADGIRQGLATGSEFRTAPLWGLRFRPFFLHDGRATTLNAAIMAHGGEALAARNNYAALSRADSTTLIQFLLSL